MTSPTAARPAPVDRRARTAVALLFLTNGALFANLIPRYPEIKAALELSNATYGLAVAAFPAGAITAGLAAAPLLRRFGSARVAVAGTILTSVSFFLAGVSPVLGALVGALFLAGAMDSFTDVAQNAHGLRVQRRYGRSIINSFHAVWSIGMVVGGLLATAAIALGLPLGVHLAISGAIFSCVSLFAGRWCLRGPDRVPDDVASAGLDGALAAGAPTDPTGPSRPGRGTRARVSGRTVGMLVALVVIAIGGTLVEDAGNTWAAVYLSGASLGAAAEIAAFGFVAFMLAQFAGRLVGDRMVDALGQRTVARIGGLLIAGGMGLALAFPSVPGTIAGFAVAGFGTATLVPAAMQQADELPGLRPGTGLTLVSWLMRIGFLVSPPIVGLIADATSLRVGLLVLPLAGILVLALSGVLAPRRAPAAPAPSDTPQPEEARA